MLQGNLCHAKVQLVLKPLAPWLGLQYEWWWQIDGWMDENIDGQMDKMDWWIEFIDFTGREIMRNVSSVPAESVAVHFQWILAVYAAFHTVSSTANFFLLQRLAFAKVKEITPINEYKMRLLKLHTCITAHRGEGAKFKVAKKTSFTLMFALIDGKRVN